MFTKHTHQLNTIAAQGKTIPASNGWLRQTERANRSAYARPIVAPTMCVKSSDQKDQDQVP